MKTLLSLILIIPFCGIAQEVNIPDQNFRQALLSFNCVDSDGDGKGDAPADQNNDGILQHSEIQSIKHLRIANLEIKSLEGIQYFTNLEKLFCHDNRLKSLDVSKNLNLLSLYCYDNQITQLDLTQNLELRELGIRDNKVTVLDLSKNTKLEVLYCYQNNLKSLNIKNGNNSNMRSMWSYDNPDLTTITLDDVNTSFPECDKENYSGWCVDEGTELRSK